MLEIGVLGKKLLKLQVFQAAIGGRELDKLFGAAKIQNRGSGEELLKLQVFQAAIGGNWQGA